MPFVVGFYETQVNRLDAELAQLVEAYFKQAFKPALAVEPQFHRVIPIGDTVPVSIDVQPTESAAAIVDQAKAWGVIDCICRKQKALVGEACGHPMEVCMVFSSVPGAFDHTDEVRSLTHEESMATLRLAADAGLIHTVGNHQDHTTYICNCCTCSCGSARDRRAGHGERGGARRLRKRRGPGPVHWLRDMRGVVPVRRAGAGRRRDHGLNRRRCVGCGQCVLHCDQGALRLVRRPEDDIKPSGHAAGLAGSARRRARPGFGGRALAFYFVRPIPHIGSSRRRGR